MRKEEEKENDLNALYQKKALDRFPSSQKQNDIH